MVSLFARGGGNPPPSWAMILCVLLVCGIAARFLLCVCSRRNLERCRWGRGGNGPPMSRYGAFSWFLFSFIMATMGLVQMVYGRGFEPWLQILLFAALGNVFYAGWYDKNAQISSGALDEDHAATPSQDNRNGD
jgi:hypothetical protein